MEFETTITERIPATTEELLVAQIEGYSGYVFTSAGSIWSLALNRFLVLDGRDKAGYRLAKLHDANGAYKTRHVHSLIAEAFYGACPATYVVDHIDRKRANNHIDNLRYVSESENIRNSARVMSRSVNSVGVLRTRSGKFVAQITAGGIGSTKYLGTYVTEAEAAQAYDKEAVLVGRKPNFEV